MKVYVVTAGEYSDYHIEKIFTDPEKAHLYSLTGCEYDYRQVEEYDVDDGGFKTDKGYIRVVYNFRNNEVTSVYLEGNPCKPALYDRNMYEFKFTLPLSNKRLYMNIMQYGKDCEYITKVAQDTFAKYCYEHDTSREKLIRKEEKKWEQRRHNYFFATTSGSMPDWTPSWEANQLVNAVLKQKIADDEPLPSAIELLALWEDKAEKVRKEHEQD